MKVDLTGKAAIVTGASKGIGYAVAEALVTAGAGVVICARDGTQLEAAAAGLNQRGPGSVVPVVCDIRSHEEVRRVVSTAVQRFDRLDLLVNNAGIGGGFTPMGELSPEVWRAVIETNLNGVYYACHEAIPVMARQGDGWIINIGSLAGRNPFAGGAAYNASKFGLLGFTEAMMLDVRDRGIRVSTIMPGSVATDFGGDSAGADDWKLQPEDIAEAVTDLLAFPGRALPSRVELRPSRPGGRK
ncbi:MAG: SDR family oxidoreductase [Gemmatimonadota bacterium]|nr:SDR family oxidoreductase [Gemmatimonadota bacterium]